MILGGAHLMVKLKRDEGEDEALTERGERGEGNSNVNIV